MYTLTSTRTTLPGLAKKKGWVEPVTVPSNIRTRGQTKHLRSQVQNKQDGQLFTQRAVNPQNTKSLGKEAAKRFTQVQGRLREILGRNIVKSHSVHKQLLGTAGHGREGGQTGRTWICSSACFQRLQLQCHRVNRKGRGDYCLKQFDCSHVQVLKFAKGASKPLL